MSELKQTRTRPRGGPAARFFRRLLLVVLTIAILLAGGLAWVLNAIFNGPSEAARDALTISLAETSATQWVPGLYLGDELVEEILGKSADKGG